MQWSINLTKISGIPIRLHATFLLLLAIAGMGGSGARGMMMLVLVFCCVLLHELGHSFIARRYGVEVESITLLPIGGVAAMKSLPKTPRAELFIALAGPAVSVLLGVLFTGLSVQFYGEGILRTIIYNHYNAPLMGELAAINFILAGFNLIPAFPMDGGRILRAILWSRKNFFRATQIASQSGQGLAVGFFLASLITGFNFWLTLIAVFIYFGAEAEGKAAEWRETISDATVADAMQRPIRILQPDEPVSTAVDIMLATGQEYFPVMENKKTIGIVSKTAILQAIRSGGSWRKAEEIMTTELIYCSPFDTLAGLADTMERRNLSFVPVMYEDKIVGLVTPEIIWQYQAMKKNQR